MLRFIVGSMLIGLLLACGSPPIDEPIDRRAEARMVVYQWAESAENLEAIADQVGEWIPTSPLVREILQEDVPFFLMETAEATINHVVEEQLYENLSLDLQDIQLQNGASSSVYRVNMIASARLEGEFSVRGSRIFVVSAPLGLTVNADEREVEAWDLDLSGATIEAAE